MKKINYFGHICAVLAALAPLLLHSTSQAQFDASNSVTIQLGDKGRAAETVITDPAIKFVVFESTSNGNLSSMATFSAGGPLGITAFAETRQIQKKTKYGGANPVQFVLPKNKTSPVLRPTSPSKIVVRAAAAKESRVAAADARGSRPRAGRGPAVRCQGDRRAPDAH